MMIWVSPELLRRLLKRTTAAMSVGWVESSVLNVPRAVMWSIVILGLFLVIVNWGVIVGWGINDIAKLPSSSVLPGLVLSERFWGGAWWILWTGAELHLRL